jgi:hypothetical protein
MGLGDTGDWQGAVNRIVGMINGEGDPLAGELPEGYGSGTLLEQFAREMSTEHGVDLGMTLPATLGCYSAAMQGGFVAPILRRWAPPQYLWVATVVQFMGIAEAGQKKSTLLEEVAGPLKTALDGVGAEHRRELCDAWRDQMSKAYGDKGISVTDNYTDWQRLASGGWGMTSWTDQGTPEALRKRLAEYAGHRAILTAEPDALRDISAYAKGNGGGSLRPYLSGWDQEDIAADRVSGDVNPVQPSLPVVMMVQPESFSRYTTGQADGHDDFVDRGVFSRMLLWRGVNQAVPFQMPDLTGFDPDTWNPVAAAPTALEKLRGLLGESMVWAVRRTNPYRVSKGILHAYMAKPPDWEMAKPVVAQRIRLELDGLEGHVAAARVQQMRETVIAALDVISAERPGHAAVGSAFAQRFSSHVMRLAAVLSVGSGDPMTVGKLDTGHVEDVATRIMPWLWAGWWRVMSDRLENVGQDLVEANALSNFKGAVLSGEVRILAAFMKLEKKLGGPAALDGFPEGAVIRAAKEFFGRKAQPKVHDSLVAQFRSAVAEGLVVKIGTGKANASGKAAARYQLTALGRELAGSSY